MNNRIWSIFPIMYHFMLTLNLTLASDLVKFQLYHETSLSLHAPLISERGQNVKNRFRSVNAHVAYQIKENDTYNNRQAIMLSLQAP